MTRKTNNPLQAHTKNTAFAAVFFLAFVQSAISVGVPPTYSTFHSTRSLSV